jgi:microcystin-dependent protein
MFNQEPAPHGANWGLLWQQFISQFQRNTIGMVAEFAQSTPPQGWIVCDGSVVSRSSYPALFSVIGTEFGAGDGSNTFRIPDLSTMGNVNFTYCIFTGV